MQRVSACAAAESLAVIRPDQPRPRRVALIASSFAPYVGGVEEHVRHVAHALQHDGVTVEVWTVERAGRSSVRDVDGISVRDLPAPLPAVSFTALLRFMMRGLPAWATWVSATRAFRPDLLHVQCFGPNGVYALALSRTFGIPLIVTSHGETVADDHGAYRESVTLRWSLRKAIARASAVTAPSGFVLRDLQEHYGLRTGQVVPNGIDMNVLADRSTELGRVFVAVGRLGRMKGFDLLIAAFAAADVDPSIGLEIIGDGPEHQNLRELVEAHDLVSRVRFRGWLDRQGVANAMAASVAVVVPSRTEAFGIVALEAWRAGAPLIMTSRGGAAEFVTDGVNGVLVDPRDQVALAEALKAVAEDAKLREIIVAGGRSSVGGFAWSRVSELYEAIYDSALART